MLLNFLSDNAWSNEPCIIEDVKGVARNINEKQSRIRSCLYDIINFRLFSSGIKLNQVAAVSYYLSRGIKFVIKSVLERN